MVWFVLVFASTLYVGWVSSSPQSHSSGGVRSEPNGDAARFVLLLTPMRQWNECTRRLSLAKTRSRVSATEGWLDR